MSSHVPSAMIRQRNSGVLSRVAALGSHQQTRRAMAAKCRETVSSVCTLLESTFNLGNLAKQTVDCEPLGRPTQPVLALLLPKRLLPIWCSDQFWCAQYVSHVDQREENRNAVRERFIVTRSANSRGSSRAVEAGSKDSSKTVPITPPDCDPRSAFLAYSAGGAG